MNRLHDILYQIFIKKGFELRNLSRTIKDLSNIYNAEKLPQPRYMSDERYLWAYIFYFYPINVYKYLTVLNYHSDIFEKKRVFFDFGAGPLTFFTALALADFKAEALFAVDSSKEILEFGRMVLKEIKPEYTKKLNLYTAVPHKSYTPSSKAELISFGNVLVEVGDEEGEKLLNEYLTDNSNVDRTVLILEPGTHKAFNRLKTIEKILKDRGYHKINSCPVENCPMSGKDWCHENLWFQRSKIIEQIENQTGLDNRFINFCYLLMSNKEGVRYHFSDDTFRMVSNLIEHKGYYLAHFCGKEGIIQVELQKRDVNETNKNFTLLKRGDIVKINNIKRKGQRFRLCADSAVKIEKRYEIRG